jgi:hypothetical protein
MRYVSRFEVDLLRIAQTIVGRAPLAQSMTLLVRVSPRPACLSRDAVEALQDVLRKGVSEWLLRQGGWKRARFLRGDSVTEGRLWQRTPPTQLGLRFSEYALDFLVWLTSENVAREGATWEVFESDSLTLGDRLLLAMAFDAVAETEIGACWARSPTFGRDGLCALLHPQLVAACGKPLIVDFGPWLTPGGVAVLESLQQRLARKWLQVELQKAKLASPPQMRSIARALRSIVEQYTQAIRAAGRRDLGRWLLVVAQQLFAGSPPAARWTGNLDVKNMRIADRMELYRDALSFVRHLTDFETWQREAASVGYFDEGYAAMQLWKSDWETYRGDAWCAAAHEVLRQVEPLGA